MPRTIEEIKKYNKDYYQRKKKEREQELSELCEFYFDEFKKSYNEWINSS
jgi:hypothetical protein